MTFEERAARSRELMLECVEPPYPVLGERFHAILDYRCEFLERCQRWGVPDGTHVWLRANDAAERWVNRRMG